MIFGREKICCSNKARAQRKESNKETWYLEGKKYVAVIRRGLEKERARAQRKESNKETWYLEGNKKKKFN